MYPFLYLFLLTSLWAQAQSGNLSYLVYGKGQGDFRLFNSMYFEKNSEFSAPEEYVFFNVQPEFLYGIGAGLNLGARLRLRNVIRSNNITGADLLSFKQKGKNGLNYQRYGISGVDIFLRHDLGQHLSSWSVQHTIGLPIGKDLEGTEILGYLDWSGGSYHGQLFYNVLWDKFQLFTELGIRLDNLTTGMFKKESDYFVYAGLPMSVLPGFLILPQHFTYLLFQANPRWSFSRPFSMTNPKILLDPFAQIGLGYKLFFARHMEFETIGTLFFSDYQHKNAFTWSLGWRYYLGRDLYGY